jgi:predicted transcriptional regulator of viral defense system
MVETKTLGPTGAQLLAAFSRREPAVFSLDEARQILGSSTQVTSNLLTRLKRQGWIVSVRSGVYEVAPLWAAQGSFAPDRFATLAVSLDSRYYVGYRSALELYGWLQHPVVGRLYIAVPKQRRQLETPRDRIVWVVTKPDRFDWGVRRHWIGSVRVAVSDRERTFLDCLHLPRHAGGITEVAACLLRAWPSLDANRLASHANRLGNGSVTRRLGALVDVLKLEGRDDVIRRLPQGRWRGRPVSFDPTLPSGGSIDPRWGVRMNVSVDELAAIGST